MALLPLVAAILLNLLLRARNHLNLPLALILALLATANLVFHLAVMGVLKVPAITPLYAGLCLIVMIECVMAGRVIPAFTMSATPDLQLQTTEWIERVTLGVTWLGPGTLGVCTSWWGNLDRARPRWRLAYQALAGLASMGHP